MLAIFSSCFKKFRGLKLAAFIILFCATTIIVRAQGEKMAQASSDLRSDLGIPANEMLARQSEQDFLQMLHKDPTLWVKGIKHKDQVPELLEDLSEFSKQQDRVAKLRIRMLVFWLKCNLVQMDPALFQDLLNETIESGQKNLQVNLILIKSLFSNADRPSLLIERFSELHDAADILMNEPDTEFTNKGLIFLSMGSLFYQVGDMVNALKYLRQASENTSGTHLKLALNTLGYVHRKLKNLDSSNFYFEQTLANAQKSNDSVYIGIASGNLGENFYLSKQFDKAIPLLETDLRIGFARKDYGLVSNAQLLLSEMYLRLGEKEKALVFMKLGRENALRSSQYHRLPLLYSTSALYFTSTGQIEKAIAAQDSLKIVSDSMARKAASIQTMNPELVYQDKKARLIQVQQKTDNEAKQQKINVLIVTLLLLLVIAGLIFWLFRLRTRLRVNRLLLEKNHLEEGILESKLTLDDYILKFREDSTLHLMDWANGKMNGGMEYQKFLQVFTNSYPGFLTDLKQFQPGLTEAEVRFCCLERLELRVKEMAFILGVSENAVHQTRSRLKNKLGIARETTLSKVLSEI